MADANHRQQMSSSSSSPTTTSSSPMNNDSQNPSPAAVIDTTKSSSVSPSMDTNKNSLNAPKYGTPVPNRVFVGGIPTDAKESEVKNLFSQFGTVVSVKIINDRAGVPRGYGFVTYETEEDAKRVMKESDNLLIKNRKLNISVAIKKQQHFSNDVNVRNHSNGSFIYSPYSIVNAASNTLYPEIVYTSDGIPVYNLGAAGQLMANCGVSSPQTSYPYTTYQTPSGLYLATTQPSLATQQFPQFQTSAGASPPAAGYPLLATPYRLPLNSQNVNQMNPYLHMSSATTPPLSQTSSLPLQVTSVANSMMGSGDGGHNMTNAVNAINSGMSSLNLLQSPVYAISPNIANHSSQSMACVQNVQLKTDHHHHHRGSDMSDNGQVMAATQNSSQPVLELVPIWAQNVPNTQSSQKPAPNRYQYNHTTAKPQQQSNGAGVGQSTVKDRPDRRNNSSYNASHHHYRKSVTNSSANNRFKGGNGGGGGVGGGHNPYANANPNANSYANSYENECQTVHQSSVPNSYALQGLPFVKHNRYHTMPYNHQPMVNVVQPVQHHHQQQLQQQCQLNGSMGVGAGGQPPMVTKMVNGVQIYAFPNNSGAPGGYGSPLTPPLTPGNHQMVHK